MSNAAQDGMCVCLCVNSLQVDGAKRGNPYADSVLQMCRQHCLPWACPALATCVCEITEGAMDENR